MKILRFFPFIIFIYHFAHSQNTISFNTGLSPLNDLVKKETEELKRVKNLIKASDSLLRMAISYEVKLGANPKNVNGEWQFPIEVTTKLDPKIYDQFVNNFYNSLALISMGNSTYQKYRELNKPINLICYFNENQTPRYANFSSAIELLNEYRDSSFEDKEIRIYADKYMVSNDVNEAKKYIKSIELQGRGDLYGQWMISIANKNDTSYSICYLSNPASFKLINDYFDNMSKILWSFTLKNEVFEVDGLTLRTLLENHTLNDFSKLSLERKKTEPACILSPGVIYFDFDQGHNKFEDNFRHVLTRSGCCRYGGLQYDLLSPFYKSAKFHDEFDWQFDPVSLSKHWTILDGLASDNYFNTNFPWGEVDSHLNNYLDTSFTSNFTSISLPTPMSAPNNSDRNPAIILGLFPSIENAIMSAEQFALQLNHQSTMLDKTKSTLDNGNYPFIDEDLIKALFVQLNITTLTSDLTNISKITLNQKMSQDDLVKIKTYSIEKTTGLLYDFPETDISALKAFMKKNQNGTEIPEVKQFVDSIFKTKFEDVFMSYMTPECAKYVSDVMEVTQGYSDKSEDDLAKLYGKQFDVKNSIFTALLETGNCGWDERKIFSQLYNGELNGGYWYEITLMGRCEGQGYSYQRINLKIQEFNGEYKISYFVAKDPY